MDPPPAPTVETVVEESYQAQGNNLPRSGSFSAASDNSQTAADFIDSQLQLEADAREALPYKFEECTKPIGKLRQILFSCLTCNPPPADPSAPYKPAGVCYSCSIQCHGEHTLVELFNKRNFVCDCGTTRLPTSAPCTLRLNPETNTKGGVHSDSPEPTNKYNHNFRNRFCGCECDYDAEQQKGTMFQCLGLGTSETGGCGEDWWHPGCIVGMGPDWFDGNGNSQQHAQIPEKGIPSVSDEKEKDENKLQDVSTNTPSHVPPSEIAEDKEDEVPLPPGFPDEDSFEGFICYKCVEAHPWIKPYASSAGFLPPVFRRSMAPSPEGNEVKVNDASAPADPILLKKRKADDDDGAQLSTATKKRKEESFDLPVIDESKPQTTTKSSENSTEDEQTCKKRSLPPAPVGSFSLFFKADFRDHLCRCAECFPELQKHEQLLEEEEIYEPPLSETDEEAGGSTVGSGSIYDRGESALKNVDRVRAIEGVMAYNHLKDKLKPFFQQFAESGQAISAEDIKAHFAKMRGDEQAIQDAGEGAKNGRNRKEQSGY